MNHPNTTPANDTDGFQQHTEPTQEEIDKGNAAQTEAGLREVTITTLSPLIEDNVTAGKLRGIADDILKLFEATMLENQTNAVAWVIGQIDLMHEHSGEEYDKIFKGIKNMVRDTYEMKTGIDSAPKYPVTAHLNEVLNRGEKS